MTRYPIFANRAVIPSVMDHKYLGVVTERTLSWSKHATALRKKLTTFVEVLRVIAGLRWGTSEKSLLNFYHTLFPQCLGYSVCAYKYTCNMPSYVGEPS